MMDAGHIETEAILKDLEKRIAMEYQQAAAEIESTLADYFKRFETKDKIWQKWVKDGTKTQKQYQEWRVGQMAMGQRWADQRDAIARDLTRTMELAKQVAYDTMPLVYAENINYGTYNIEHVSKLDTNYTLYDRNAAASALSEKKLYHDPGEETTRRIAEGLEMRWNKQQIQSVMLQGLLQGESIPKLSKRLASTVSTKDMNASIRNARTMTTGVQNAGRVDSYKRAQNMGIDTRKQWMATLDGRTRHSHRMLDGEIADVNKKFSNGCEFPGDPNGRPEEVYNCRCTLIAALKGFERNLSDTSLRYNEKLGDMSYEEWKKAKPTYQSIRHQEKQGQKYKDMYTDEYKNQSNKIKQPLPKGDTEAYNRIESSAKANKLDYLPVDDLPEALTGAEIIEKLAGGDMTKGSCASLALAYCANKVGLDVTDFRGGKSQSQFSRYFGGYIDVMKAANAHIKNTIVKKEASGVAKLLADLQENKEYLLSCGRHATIVRNNAGALEYLEMQSHDENGWKPFAWSEKVKTKKYDFATSQIIEYEATKKRTVADTLYYRFGCRKTVGGHCYITDVETFEKTEELKKAMGYINTSKAAQQKGVSGGIK